MITLTERPKQEVQHIKEWFTPERIALISPQAVDILAKIPVGTTNHFTRGWSKIPVKHLQSFVETLMLLGYVPVREVDIDYIKEVVCKYEKIKLTSLDTKTREGKFVKPRQICMFFIKEKKLGTNHSIAKIFNKNPATVQFAVKTINNLIDTEPAFKNKMETIRQKLR